MLNYFPFHQQINENDCGPVCLQMILSYYQDQTGLDVVKDLCSTDLEGTSLAELEYALKHLGYEAIGAMVSMEYLEEAQLPCIVHWQENHYVVVYKITKTKVYIADPAVGKLKLSYSEFINGWKREEDLGIVLLIERNVLSTINSKSSNKSSHSLFRFAKSIFSSYGVYTKRIILFVLATGLISLLFPFLTQVLVDHGIRNEDLTLVYIIVFAHIIFYVSQSIAEVLKTWLLLKFGNRISYNIISGFFTKLFQFHISFFDKRSPGDVFQRLYDIERIESFFTSNTLNIFFTLLSLTVYLPILFIYDSNIFLIFVFFTALIILWIYLFQSKRKILDNQRFQILSSDNIYSHQLIYGMQEIQLNQSADRRKEQWQSNRIRYFNFLEKMLSTNQYQNTGVRIINELKNIIIIFVAAKLVIEGSLTLGILLAIMFIIGQLNYPLLESIHFFHNAQDASLSFKRLHEFFKEKIPEETHDTIILPKQQKDIIITQLDFRYGPKYDFALKDINLTIIKNKVTAIVGASGSGKTTLLKLLLKYYQPEKGLIQLDSFNLNHISKDQWLSMCGIVMQEGYIFYDSILRNITESRSKQATDLAKVWKVLELTKLHDFVLSLPHGLNTRIGNSGLPLSGGQKQRLLLCRALYKDPQYLFFDEATSHLDAETEKIIVNNLNRFFNNRTVVVIAHRLSTVKHADQIVVMDQGKIIELGNHHQLIHQKGAYYELIQNQLDLNGKQAKRFN